MTPPIPDAEKPSGSVPIFPLWMGVHLGLIAGAAVLVEAFSRQGLAWIVVVGPSCLGAAQAGAFRDTVAVSMRLAYGEMPEPVLRRIWSHEGPFGIKGALGRTRPS